MNLAKTTIGKENGTSSKQFAKPLHLQRLEASLDMGPFMSFAHKMLSQPLASTDSDTDDEENDGAGRAGGRYREINCSKEERQSDKAHVYNLATVTSEREWLCDVLLSDTETESEISDEDDYVKEMLKCHVREQKLRESYYKKEKNTQYGYYGTGLLSAYDMFPEHQRSIVGVRKRRKEREKKEKLPKIPKPRKQRRSKHGDASTSNDAKSQKWVGSHNSLPMKSDFGEDGFDSKSHSPMGSMKMPHSGRGRKKKSALAKTPELMAARRRKVWQLMSKKELGKIQRAKANNHKEMLQSCKRVATMCMKVTRQKAMQSQKIMKETIWRAKRLTREMQGYWKRYDRVERETRRRMEKEAEEQRKIDVEIIEAKRQQRKLNFLITQTELYAHFMSKKLGHGTEEEQLRILNQLDEEMNPRLSAYDDYDSELMKQLAQKNASDAFDADRARTRQFDVGIKAEEEPPLLVPSLDDGKPDLPQPALFRGTLKTYQLKGMTWLANIYDQGISGILADEMGLGKTVQSIAFLCHIAENYGVWGPFLVISPASTLHNWQQEMQRFVPDFNVVPYWGSPNERKILRQFWEQKDLHTKDASFHVVITSYQLIVSDYKYFNRIKWQYMVLDEAQAIKSSSSMRWKLLLGFNCRNRLLLSGTPIQNSMAELWALLHFIMPTLFDSHEEFNEWFSKDIESHAENKTGIDEKQISRLHMILKPFMLRRIKKDVENELSDKIEIMVYCPLTTRQKLLYMALKKKIRIEDLLHYTIGGGNDGHHVDRNFTSNLMNLVMQFRKVCNHPELFERRDAKSPFTMKCEEYVIPRLVYDEALLSIGIPSKRHLLYNRFSVFKTEHVYRSLFGEARKPGKSKKSDNYPRYVDLSMNSPFSFSRFCDLCPKDVEDMTVTGIIGLLKHYLQVQRRYADYAYRMEWWEDYSAKKAHLLEPTLQNALDRRFLLEGSVVNAFLFTRMTSRESSLYTFGDYQVVNMQETIEHRVIRSRKRKIQEIGIATQIKSEGDNTDDDYNRQVMLKEEPKLFKSPPRGRPPKNPDKNLKSTTFLLPEFPHIPRPPIKYFCEGIEMPRFIYGLGQRVQAVKRRFYCESRAAEWAYIRHIQCDNQDGYSLLYGGLELCKPRYGWSSIVIPDKQTLVSDAGKLSVLDSLLTRLKAQGHRVLIYSQMTKMIDLLEEYMWHRKHRYMRLDGSSKISARRDMVADFQSRADIFVFLLSTRAGGLGINLTAADTVIFYDSDWNPTVDQQAMDRAHRLGQTKQVTVYRLICKGTIEERILQRAREKSEIQRMVISGGNFKPDTLKPKEVVSLLLDDEEIELKYRQKTEERKSDELPAKENGDKKRKLTTKVQPADGSGTTPSSSSPTQASKRFKIDPDDDSNIDVGANSPVPSERSHVESFVPGATPVVRNDDSSNEALIVDCDTPIRQTSPNIFNHFESIGRSRRRHHPRGTKRGRPRGSRRGGGNGTLGRSDTNPSRIANAATPTSNETNSGNTTTEHLTNTGEGSFVPTIPPVKRGPGRPRLKPGGPPNPGTRGTSRPRKPIGPLVVPLGQSPAATPLNRSPAISPAPSPASERSAVSYYQPNDGEN